MADGSFIAQQARETSPNAGAFGDCKRCDKIGLPILPLRFAYTLRDTEYRKYQVNEEAAGFKLNGGELALRMLNDGYLYLLDERHAGTWRVFHVGKEGDLWEFPARTVPDVEGFQCGRADHLARSCVLVIPRPEEAERIWLAYSSVRYTQSRLDAFKAALMEGKGTEELPASLLSSRFQLFHVSTLMTMENSGDLAQSQARVVDAQGEVFAGLLPEFDGMHARFDGSITPGRDLRDEARSIAEKMNLQTRPQGVTVFLDDPVGIAMEVRHYARATALEIAEVDKKYEREVYVDTIAERLRASWEKAGANKASEWLEDYQDKLDPVKVEDFRTSYRDERNPLQGQLELLGLDARACLKRYAFETACKVDFDGDDEFSTSDFVTQAGTILAGLNLSEGERTLALELLDKPVDENIWYRVLLADQKGLLKSLAEPPVGNVADMLKSAYSAFDEWASANSGLAASLQAGVAGGSLPVQSGATATLARTERVFRATLPLDETVRLMTLSLQGLLTDAKVAGYGNLRVFSLSGALWYNAVAVPFVETPTWAELLRDNKEAAWGTPLAHRATGIVDGDGRKIRRVNIGDYTDELGEAARKRIPLLRIQVIGDGLEVASLAGEQGGSISRQQRRAEQRALQKMERAAGSQPHLPQRTKLAAAMDVAMADLRVELEAAARRAEALRRTHARQTQAHAGDAHAQRAGVSAATPVALAGLPHAPPGGGWSQRTLAVMRHGGTQGGLATLVGAFQAVAMTAAWKEYADKGGGEAVAKLTASMLGLIGASLEVTAAGMKLAEYSGRPVGGVLGRIGARRLAAVGGGVGGAAGAISGVLTYREGLELEEDGDIDAGILFRLAGVLFVVSGTASIGAGVATLGFLAGPVGWALLAVGTGLVGIVLLFAGESRRDNPLQTWLRKSRLGRTDTYENKEEEVHAFEEVFALPLELRMQWRQGASIFGRRLGGTVVVEVEVPQITRDSWLEYSLCLEMGDGRRLTLKESRLVSDRPGTGIVDQNQLLLGTPGRNPGLAAPSTGSVLSRTEKGGARWQFVYNEGALRRVSAELRYWPDRDTNPELIVPDAGGMKDGITQMDAKK